jgi:hypothetical protein
LFKGPDISRSTSPIHLKIRFVTFFKAVLVVTFVAGPRILLTPNDRR